MDNQHHRERMNEEHGCPETMYCIKMLVYTYVYIYAYIFIVNGPSPKYVLFFMHHE
jgi:hypothetical protein